MTDTQKVLIYFRHISMPNIHSVYIPVTLVQSRDSFFFNPSQHRIPDSPYKLVGGGDETKLTWLSSLSSVPIQGRFVELSSGS